MVFSFIKNLLGGGDRPDDTKDRKAPAAPAAAPAPKAPQFDSGEAEGEEGVSTANIEQFVRYVVTALVDEPANVTLQTVDKGRNTTINITCAKPDMGKIIGRNGKTISAIRALAASAAGKAGRKVSVEVLD